MAVLAMRVSLFTAVVAIQIAPFRGDGKGLAVLAAKSRSPGERSDPGAASRARTIAPRVPPLPRAPPFPPPTSGRVERSAGWGSGRSKKPHPGPPRKRGGRRSPRVGAGRVVAIVERRRALADQRVVYEG